MVKIQIEDPTLLEEEYSQRILPLVLFRINVLKKSLNHLQGLAINTNDPDFVSFKAITKKIVLLVENGRNPVGSYNKADYQANITTYTSSLSNLYKINFTKIYLLLDSITANNNTGLKNILICPPQNLNNTSNNYLDFYGITNDIDKNIIKLGFNYEEFESISKEIRSFFREKNLAKYCPYCNLTEVKFRATNQGLPGTTHQLDHFFDKATSFLLSYSLYNLIPSDSTCNGINKHINNFSDEYHLNPYIAGFGSSMAFKPKIVGSKVKVASIEIEICEPNNSVLYKQLIGDGATINEGNLLGNINVFKLFTKYNDRTRKAERILLKLKKTNENYISINKYLYLINKLTAKNNYLKWYIDNIETPFHYSQFNEEAYSKFNRDIHDYYYSLKPTINNRYIRELITENSS